MATREAEAAQPARGLQSAEWHAEHLVSKSHGWPDGCTVEKHVYRVDEWPAPGLDEAVRLLREVRQHWDAGSIDSDYDGMASAFDAAREWLYANDPLWRRTQARLRGGKR